MIPTCVKESDDYKNLTDKERLNFENRLHFCVEISLNVKQFVDTKDVARNGFLDDVEVDTYSLFSTYHSPDSLSPWLMHSSWTCFSDREAMRSEISDEFNNFVKEAAPGVDDDVEYFVDWYRKWLLVFNGALNGFQQSKTFDAALAQCIALDALMSMLILSTAIARLNPRMFAS